LSESFGQLDKVGMEGTGQFGAGLCGSSPSTGLTVVEADGPTVSAGG
jgi:hypothetical protein